ncbi:hypothetical protein Tco_1551698 [Tanacetum coccineum]
MVSRWKDRVASRPSSLSGSSSHDIFAPSSEFPISPVVAPPGIHRRPAILIRPGEAIPFVYAPLSTPYPPTTSDSSSDSFVGSSRKRCRTPTITLSLPTPTLGVLIASHAHLLPLRERFRDSYSPKDSKEEHMEIGTADAEVVADLGIGDGVRDHVEDDLGMRVEIAASDIKEDEEEFEVEANAGGTIEIAVDPLVTGGISESTRAYVLDLEDTFYDMSHYVSKVPLDRITEFEIAQRQLEVDQLVARGERAALHSCVES